MCAEPRGLVNWQADEAEGEARRGGTLRLHWSAFESTVELEIIRFEPERQLTLKQGQTEVDFHFEPGRVTLVQRGLEAEDDVEGLHSSWQLALAQLAHCIERHPTRQRRVEWLVRQVHTSPQLVYLALTDPHLCRWLCRSGGITAQGERYELTLPQGIVLSGKVMTNVPGRDIALTCDAAGEAVLVFRTLPSPTDPAARLIAAVWSEWGPPRELADEIIEAVDACMEQLVSLLARVGSA
jgi:uncharacterized protein YndB with AHSA1/START domain